MTNTSLLSFSVVLFFWSCANAAEPPVNSKTDAFTDVLQPVFKQHCVKCHGKNETAEADVDLFALMSSLDLTSRAELLDDLITAIDSGNMPPEDERPLEISSRERLVLELKSMLETAVALRKEFIQTPIRRMNRFQYNNAIVDLFELKVETYPLEERMMRDLSNYFQPQYEKMPSEVTVTSRPLGKDKTTEQHLRGLTPFPQDLRAEHGFDNRGDHLTLSPMLLESFIQLSQSIIESPDFNEKTCGIWPEFFAAPCDSDVETIRSNVHKRLQAFLMRAFRRPVDRNLVDRYVGLVLSRIASGVPFEGAMKEAASAAIASPRFFYQFDATSAGTEKQFDDFNLASRLSFFLWGSIPDQALMQLAITRRLREPDVLRQQVGRMLHDKRLKRFCDSFPSQWLQLERIISAEPDEDLFPQFYFAKYRASMHMMLEPLLLFESILIENHSILELIDSDFSYRSDLLDSWYRDGTQGKAGPPTQVVLKRVPVTDRRQGGVITSAAVLTMTSGTIRTKPITRGAWLATVIFNDPPEPPPGDVTPLPDKASADEENLTLRERFVAHRKNKACVSCHQRIDPLGFALENFNAAGIWRDKYENGLPIDASGKLFAKHSFQDVVGFKEGLLAERDRFTRAFAEHLLSFATGREITVADSSAVNKIVRETAAADYRIRTLIEQVVLSDSFQR